MRVETQECMRSQGREQSMIGDPGGASIFRGQVGKEPGKEQKSSPVFMSRECMLLGSLSRHNKNLE